MSSTSGCCTRHSPSCSPRQGMKLSTPGGSPASRNSEHELPAVTGGTAGRLVEDRIAGDQSGGHHARGDGQGEIPGGDDQRRPPRPVEIAVVLAGDIPHPGRAVEAEHLPCRSIPGSRSPRSRPRQPQPSSCRSRTAAMQGVRAAATGRARRL